MAEKIFLNENKDTGEKSQLKKRHQQRANIKYFFDLAKCLMCDVFSLVKPLLMRLIDIITFDTLVVVIRKSSSFGQQN